MAVITVSNTGGNWNATTTWVGGVIPVLGDDVITAATSGPLTVNTTTAACTSINFTNYTNTFTISSGQTLTVSGNVTFVAGMTVAGTGTLAVNVTATLTSAGKTLTGSLTFSGTSQVFTFADNWTISGNLTLSGTTAMTLTSNTIYVGGNLTSTTAAATSGTTTIVLNGTGTWSNSSTGVLSCNLTINTSGTITVSGTVRFNSATLTHLGGSVVTTGSTLSMVNNTTLNTSGMTWGTITNAGNITVTLTSDLNVVNLTSNSSGTVNFNSNNIYVSGNLSHIGTGIIAGTSNIILNGTGTWSVTSTGTYRNNLTINTTGTITISGNVYYNTNTLKYTAGTVITTGSTLNITLNGTTTLDTNGIIWNSIYTGNNLTTTVTVNLVSDLVTTNLTCGYSTTFTTTGAILTVSNNLSFTNPSAGLFAMSFVYYLPNDLVVNNLTFSYGYVSAGGVNNPTYIYNYSITVLKDITLTRPGTSNPSSYGGLNGTTKVIWKPQNEGTFNIGTIATGGNLYSTCIMVPFILDNGKKYNFNSIQCSINSSDFQINSSGNMKLSGNLTIVGGTFKCTNNSVDASNLNLQITNGASSAVFTDVHKIVFKSIDIVASTTTIMNEFFSGSPKTITAINSTTTANYVISFSDGFEKITKFVNINNCTLSKPQQLLLITKSPMKSTNVRGIRYINQSPNGVAKSMLYSMDDTYKTQMLTSDPSKIAYA